MSLVIRMTKGDGITKFMNLPVTGLTCRFVTALNPALLEQGAKGGRNPLNGFCAHGADLPEGTRWRAITR
jgi:hypothetical protein